MRHGLGALLLLLIAGCSSPPDYCEHYEAWSRAVREVNRIEARNGVGEWPASEIDRFEAALARQFRHADRLWDAAPDNASWVSVERACG